MTPHPVPTRTELPDLPPADLLLPYQAETSRLLASTSLLVIDKSRRIGLTWGLAVDAVLTASAQKSAGGKDAMYISYSQEMTREFIDACAMWAKALMDATLEVGEMMFADQDEKGHTREIKAFRITFASGFEIVALSSAPRSLRGKQGLLIIDEAAFVDNLPELLKAAMAFLIWGGKVVVVSTHNGVDNPFNLLIDEIRAGKRKGKVLTISFNDALADGLYERIALVKGETPTPEGKAAFIADVRGYYGDDAEEELDCIPKTGAGSLISVEKMMACTHKHAGNPDMYGGGLCVGGRDVAIRKTGDLPVIHVAEIVGPILWLRERWKQRGATFAEQDSVMKRVFRVYKMLRFGIDQTGMGEKVVEDAVRDHGDRVEGILMTGPNRLNLALALQKRFDDETIVIPDDPDLRRDIRAIKKTKGTGGAVRIVNDGEVHADEFWALALCCLMAGDDPPAFRGYRAAGRRDPMSEGGPLDIGTGEMFMRAEDADRRSTGPRFGKGAW